ncbi:hypothetical protein B0A50_08316 [Salinomyces thailandicus]|uniref:Phospholipid-transporting ATPase n=1 Tax=Salinomyces thailandicus TaxID=706561 RepID=A0A4U0TK42_9PEZI|nr:hypothetical protein B0A50_08316 [Salinomyces thailandica]
MSLSRSNSPLAHPDAYSDDDNDLELNDLDPVTALTADPNRRSHDWGRRIPLQNLRRFAPSHRRRPREEDEEALVPEGKERDAEGEGLGDHKRELSEVDAPLLANGGGGGRRLSNSAPGDFNAHGRRRRGLWRFLPFTKRSGAITLPSTTPEPDSEDAHDPASARSVFVGSRQAAKYPANAVSNAKYSPWSFLPRTLFNEFKFFFNLYFLLVALSQIIPALRIGYLSTYIAPLAFVLCITLGKEAYDDIERRRRDREANGEPYTVLKFEEGGGASGVGNGERKRKISRLSERKRGKRRRVSLDEDEASRLAEVEREEHAVEDVDAASTTVTEILKPSRDLKVGDVVVLSKDQRVPADVVVLKSFSVEAGKAPAYDPPDSPRSQTEENAEALVDMHGESSEGHPTRRTDGQEIPDTTTTEDPSDGGEAFIRTDQLDGETDWKLRLACPLTQTLPASEYPRLCLTAGKPDKRVNDFTATIDLLTKPHWRGEHAEGLQHSNPLTIDNTAWANTVLASNTTVHAVVVYTGPQTRAALSTAPSRSKTGLIDLEINALTKVLCLLTAALSAALVVGHHIYTADFTSAHPGNARPWYLNLLRFLILFSTIVPISLRVNLDMGKSVYAYMIHRDQGIPGTVVRTSTIPEELGRVEYLLSDKTGTLTRNEMELKKVHVGTVGYAGEAMEEVTGYVRAAFDLSEEEKQQGKLWTPSSELASVAAGGGGGGGGAAGTRTRREIAGRVRDLVLALALCHNVTPTIDDTDASGQPITAYQASSPDEIAIVQWTEAVGLRVAHRDRKSLTLESARDGRTVVRVEILHLFPFTSESKRMGLVARFCRIADKRTDDEGDIVFWQKGADTVMNDIVAANDWLEEETGNMAREGLRTLVVGRKALSQEAYAAFARAYQEASLSMTGRDAAMGRVVKNHLEQELDLLGITGVEDKLQPDVKPSLELLRNAGLKIWMLTGDKVETARCVAISSKLVARNQRIHTITGLNRKEAALDALAPLQGRHGAATALLIDGQSLALYLAHHTDPFITTAVRLPAVIATRCSPTQKADLALLIRAHTGKRTACIGDGGNDVSMIQAADIGLGLVGKEGRQASLAADFSLTTFSHLPRLLLWHGRNSYKRTAKLTLAIMHRGLLAAVAQALFSISAAGEPAALYRDWLLVGFATIYTMMPLFSLVLDRDLNPALATLYPELYRDPHPSRAKRLGWKPFFITVAITVYQGLTLQTGAQLLTPGASWIAAPSGPNQPPLDQRPGVKRMITLSYTVLLLTVLLTLLVEITTLQLTMILTFLVTIAAYIGSLPLLGDYFDLKYFLQVGFWWRLVVLVAVAVGPVAVGKGVGRRMRPSGWRKVRGV